MDHFKQVNDTWGHEIGDRLLVEIGSALQAALRPYDLCGRWGGEEFLLLLPETRMAEAGPIIQRVRDDIRNMSVRIGTDTLSVTASFGVAEFSPGENYSQTLNRADAALLEAKRGGRDRCVFSDG
ncbi:Response regulator PleD [compost metagenome]